MKIRLISAVVLCFLGLDLVDMKVTQTPRYLVKHMGEEVFLTCVQDMGHDRMYWYRQDPGLGLRLIHLSYGVNSNSKGDIPEGYGVSRKKQESFTLILESAKTNETSVYFCASSSSTALHSYILSTQKENLLEGLYLTTDAVFQVT